MSRSSPPNTSAEAAGERLPETVPIPAGSALASPLFHLGRTPVTNLQYAPFLASGHVPPPPWWSDPRFASPAQPVVGVSWGDAVAFCDWLSAASRARWRLPTEAEWELAVCGGQVAPRTPWGDALPPGEIPEGPLEAPWETGRGTPNAFGLLDPGTMVHEWCLNWSGGDTAGTGRRASKGGSWRHAIRWSAPAAASSLPPDYRYSDYGFRVLCEVPGIQ